MKKRSMLLAVILVMAALLTFGSTAFASDINMTTEKTSWITYEKAEITNLDLLYSRAIKGISDIPKEALLNTDFTTTVKPLQDTNTQIEALVKKNATAQVLKREIMADGSIVEEIAVTTFSDVYLPLKAQTSLLRDTGKDDYTYDETSSVKAYSTIYYTKKQYNGSTDNYLLTKVTGGWTVVADNVQVTNREVRYYNIGNAYNTGNLVDNNKTQRPSTNSFSYSTGFTTHVIKASANIGATQTATLKRGTASWSFEMLNNLFNNY